MHPYPLPSPKQADMAKNDAYLARLCHKKGLYFVWTKKGAWHL